MWEWKERASDITWGSLSEKSSTLREQAMPPHPLGRSVSHCCIILSNSGTFNKPSSIVFNFMKRNVNKNADIIGHWPFQPTKSTKKGETWQQDGGWILLSEAQEEENLNLNPGHWAPWKWQSAGLSPQTRLFRNKKCNHTFWKFKRNLTFKFTLELRSSRSSPKHLGYDRHYSRGKSKFHQRWCYSSYSNPYGLNFTYEYIKDITIPSDHHCSMWGISSELLFFPVHTLTLF